MLADLALSREVKIEGIAVVGGSEHDPLKNLILLASFAAFSKFEFFWGQHASAKALLSVNVPERLWADAGDELLIRFRQFNPMLLLHGGKILGRQVLAGVLGQIILEPFLGRCGFAGGA